MLSFVRTDDEAIAVAGKQSDRPTSDASSTSHIKDLSSMALDYKNPNDWGKSPLTDSALRLQQLKAEIEADNKANALAGTLCVRRQENESTQGA